MEKLMFEVGRRYRTRDGGVALITSLEGGEYPIGALGDAVLRWNPQGNYYRYSNSSFDLMPGPIDDTPPSAVEDRAPDTAQSELAHWRARAEKAEAKLKRIYQCLESGLKVPVICERGEGYHEGLTDIVSAAGVRIVPPQPLRVEDAE